MSGVGDLHDGFKEVFSYEEHKGQICNFVPIEVLEENMYIRDRKDVYLSLDSAGVYLWAREHQYPDQAPHIQHLVKFPKSTPGFITSIVYIPKLKVYVGAALDMSFKVYNKSLQLIESITHEERAVLSMIYDASKELIVMAGANGVSVWRIFRTTGIGMENIMERMYVFDELKGMWISQMYDEPKQDLIYALVDNSVYILSLYKRKCVQKMLHIHEGSVSAICWYPRSQFYLTGCVDGHIKCWTYLGSSEKGSGGAEKRQSEQESSGSGHDQTLLHTFSIHTAPVTGIVLHPTSGMAISTGLDGFIRILNLEMFTEIYCINLHGMGVARMIDVDLPPAPLAEGEPVVKDRPRTLGILFSSAKDNSIKLWRITSISGFFGVSSSDVLALRKYENMHIEKYVDEREREPPKPGVYGVAGLTSLVNHYAERKHAVEDDATKAVQELLRQQNLHIDSSKSKQMHQIETPVAISNYASDGEDGDVSQFKNIQGRNIINVVDAFGKAVESTFKVDAKVAIRQIKKGALDKNADVPDEKELSEKKHRQEDHDHDMEELMIGEKEGEHDFEHEVDQNGVKRSQKQGISESKNEKINSAPPGPHEENTYVASLAGRDLRLFTGKGKTIGCVDPEVVVNGILGYTVSVYQHMLFALFENGTVNVYCMRDSSAPGQWARELASITKEEWGRGSVNVDQETFTCMSLVNVLPLEAKKPPAAHVARFSRDMRGDGIPLGKEELVVIGTKSGSLIFLDTMNDCKAAHIMNASQDCINDVYYRHRRREMFTVGPYSGEKGEKLRNVEATVVRVWKLPGLECICEVSSLEKISPFQEHPNAFSISSKLPHFGLGCTDGDTRVFLVYKREREKQIQNKLEAERVENANKQAISRGNNDSDGLDIPKNEGNDGHQLLGKKQRGGYGFMEVMLRSGDAHLGVVVALSFCDELKLYATCSSDKCVKVWTLDKQIIRTIHYNMPTITLLFNSDTRPGDCLFTQFSYVLNITRKLWDEGGALDSIRNHIEQWPDAGIGAGLFVADVDSEETIGAQNKAANDNKVVVKKQASEKVSAYFTSRGGKYTLGSMDPEAPLYDLMKDKILKSKKEPMVHKKKESTHTHNKCTDLSLDRNKNMPDDFWDEYWEEGNEIDTRSPRIFVQNQPSLGSHFGTSSGGQKKRVVGRVPSPYSRKMGFVPSTGESYAFGTPETPNNGHAFIESVTSPENNSGNQSKKDISSRMRRATTLLVGSRGASVLLADKSSKKKNIESADKLGISGTVPQSYKNARELNRGETHQRAKILKLAQKQVLDNLPDVEAQKKSPRAVSETPVQFDLPENVGITNWMEPVILASKNRDKNSNIVEIGTSVGSNVALLAIRAAEAAKTDFVPILDGNFQSEPEVNNSQFPHPPENDKPSRIAQGSRSNARSNTHQNMRVI